MLVVLGHRHRDLWDLVLLTAIHHAQIGGLGQSCPQSQRSRWKRSTRLAGLSVKANGWFPKGTGPELGKTGAKPEIWQNQQDFVSKLRAFQGAAQAFNAAAKAGDMNAIKARYADLNGACKACHDKYRMEMHH